MSSKPSSINAYTKFLPEEAEKQNTVNPVVKLRECRRDPVTNAVLPMPIKFYRMGAVWYSQEAELLDFSIPNMLSASIDVANEEVWVVMPTGTNFSALTPDVVDVSPYASVYPPAGMTMDFTNPVIYTVTAQDTTVKEDYEVTVTDITAVDEPLLPALAVFPNPTENKLFIESKEAVKLELFTIDGRLLMEAEDVTKHCINMSVYQKGLYILRINHGISQSLKKIVLK